METDVKSRLKLIFAIESRFGTLFSYSTIVFEESNKNRSFSGRLYPQTDTLASNAEMQLRHGRLLGERLREIDVTGFNSKKIPAWDLSRKKRENCPFVGFASLRDAFFPRLFAHTVSQWRLIVGGDREHSQN